MAKSRQGKPLSAADIEAFCAECDQRDITYVRTLDAKIDIGIKNVAPPRNIDQLKRFFETRALAAAVIRPTLSKTELSGSLDIKGIEVTIVHPKP